MHHFSRAYGRDEVHVSTSQVHERKRGGGGEIFKIQMDQIRNSLLEDLEFQHDLKTGKIGLPQNK